MGGSTLALSRYWSLEQVRGISNCLPPCLPVVVAVGEGRQHALDFESADHLEGSGTEGAPVTINSPR